MSRPWNFIKKARALDRDNPDIILKVAWIYNTLEWTENAASELVSLRNTMKKQHHYDEAF